MSVAKAHVIEFVDGEVRQDVSMTMRRELTDEIPPMIELTALADDRRSGWQGRRVPSALGDYEPLATADPRSTG